jgi:PAS domain S-box-containing protein
LNGQASQPKDQLVDELLGLEEQRLSATPLGAASQARYRQLVRTLFGGAEDDRRRFVRVDARRPARIQHAGFELPAEVTSMSVGGLFLHTEEPDPALVGKEVDVVVELHHVEKHPISLRARVCRVASAPDQAQGFGVELLDLDAQQRDSLANQLKEQLLAALQASEEQYRFFFEHSSDVALLLDRGGHVQQVSEAGASLLGCTHDTLSGAHLDALVALDDLPRATEALEKLEEQNSVRIEIELLDRNGGRIPVLATFQPVRAHSLCVGSIVAADDLRERKRREQEQRTMERRLFQMDKLATLGQVTAGIAHDINNPLAYMLSNLTVLEQNLDGLVEAVGAARSGRVASMTPKALESLNGSLPELIGDSLEGCRRIRDIIKQLRDFSRVDNSAEIPVDVNAAVDASIQVIRNLINHHCQLERDYAADLPRTLCNFGRFSQVVLNLLSNAVKAFEGRDRDRNRIRVTTRQTESGIVVSVTDNGRGIAPELRSRILEPFFTTRARSGGTGLGLAIVQDNVRMLGGTLEIESALGEGTTFSFTLPVRTPPPEKERPPSGHPSSPARRRILIVDDDPAVLRGLKRLLGARYEVVPSPSATHALELVGQHHFDAILCDLMMPEMTGVEFHRSLSERDPESARRTILMTGGVFVQGDHDALADLDIVVLTKPVDPEDLIAALASVTSE